MTDTIIKGSGNSRTLKTVPNLGVLAPTYDKLLELITGDGLPVDLLGPNPEGCQVIGSNLNKATLLKDETAALYDGLPDNPTPDDVFLLINDIIYRLSSGKAKITVTVKLSNGTPAGDVHIIGLKTKDGTDVFTNSNGVAIGYVNPGTISVSITDHIDLTSNAVSVNAKNGGAYSVVLTATKRDFFSTVTSGSFYVSALVKSVSVSVGGAGGGGSNGKTVNMSYSMGGCGGGGGHATQLTNIKPQTRTKYLATVGSGGANGVGTNNNEGAKGGSSSFMGVSAEGGDGAKYNQSSYVTTQADGNGKGGLGAKAGVNATNATNGTQTIFSSISGTATYGGGGAGGGYYDTSYPNNNRPNGSNGSPGGGKGSTDTTSATQGGDGTGGGGGGGACTYTGTNISGKRGGNGKVTARIYF